MAKNRSRRLRKKLCVDEFQELGFELGLEYRDGLSEDQLIAFLEAFLAEAIEANGLHYMGDEEYGFVCLGRRGSVSEEQRQAVETWLKGREEVSAAKVSALLDVWYPDSPLNAEA